MDMPRPGGRVESYRRGPEAFDQRSCTTSSDLGDPSFCGLLQPVCQGLGASHLYIFRFERQLPLLLLWMVDPLAGATTRLWPANRTANCRRPCHSSGLASSRGGPCSRRRTSLLDDHRVAVIFMTLPHQTSDRPSSPHGQTTRNAIEANRGAACRATSRGASHPHTRAGDEEWSQRDRSTRGRSPVVDRCAKTHS